jgi:4-hydroxyproline epimerase
MDDPVAVRNVFMLHCHSNAFLAFSEHNSRLNNVFKIVDNEVLFGMGLCQPIHVIDSHTEGEPTRVVIAGGPDLGKGPISERLQRFCTEYDHFRSGIVCEPRGSEVVVGALLLDPVESDSSAAVIFFNDVGFLGMCGHGIIGVLTTLAHLRRIDPGLHRIETPVGTVQATLHEDGSVTVENVPSYRYRAGVGIQVPEYGSFTGDVAWGGNWFFLVTRAPCELTTANRSELIATSMAIRAALHANGVTGHEGAYIDHIEFFSAPMDRQNSSRNFVLCPGASFDRSPCGTGTSAKMACLYDDGKLAPGVIWRQEGILGTVFQGSIREGSDGQVNPSIRGRAWVTGESKLLFAGDDPFSRGIRF